MFDKIFALSEHLKEIEKSTIIKARQVRESFTIKDETILEQGITHNLSKSSVSFSVCAVDSGFITQALQGADIVLIKACATNFLYENSKLISTIYLPSRFPPLNMEFRVNLNEHDNAIFKSLIRLKYEISLALVAIEKFTPSILLIDGSIMPTMGDRPSKESTLLELYLELMELYKKLYNICLEKNILLFGVIKDTRAKRVVDLFSVEKSSDSFFLNCLLKSNERTFVMTYTTNDKSSVIKDLEPFSLGIFVFYMKANDDDFPLRIEFLNPKDNPQYEFDGIANKIYSICLVNETHAYPAPLTEVDLCAAITIEDSEGFNIHITSGRMLKPLRRNSRPFR